MVGRLFPSQGIPTKEDTSVCFVPMVSELQKYTVAVGAICSIESCKFYVFLTIQ